MKKFAEYLKKFIEFICLVSVTLMLVVVVIQVVSRIAIKTSPRWCEEVASVLMAWFTFLGIAIGVHEGIHMAIEVIVNRLPKNIRKAFEIGGQLLMGYFGFSLVLYGGRLVYATRTSTLPATKWPAFMPYLMTPLAGFSILVFIIVNIIKIAKDQPIKEIEVKGGE